MSSRFLLENLVTHESVARLRARYRKFDVSAMETFFCLLGAAGTLMANTDTYWAKRRTSQGRIRVLMQLAQSPEAALSPCELAAKNGVTRATMTGLLDGLEREGFIRRHGNPEDRRSIRISLLPKGEKFLDSVMPDRLRHIAMVMRHFSENERADLNRLLHKLSAHLHAEKVGTKT